MNLVLIDYGIGNIKSIKNAFKKSGENLIISRERSVILNSDGLILPGVGAFSHAMSNLINYDLVDILKDFASLNKPILGICLGMQLLFEESEEFGITKGLGLINGKVIKIPLSKSKSFKLPHISWNEIKSDKKSWNDTILENLTNSSNMYFVHSFYAKPQSYDDILSFTDYLGFKFCSTVKKNNIFGCQFHPEKSGPAGLSIIKNFIEICKKN